MIPTRSAGLARLANFAPAMAEPYAKGRNHDEGPGSRQSVSGLSPWLRFRLLSEEEVVAMAKTTHGAAGAEKFIQEVLWRTYWKGWLEQHPQVWRDYRDLVARASPAECDAVARIEAGQSGIACMDAWIRELIETGYLHNHARMWFASIWCFTLGLPWHLGADLFLRYLRDGDAASNTLSWRWVAGLQTRGKHYVARADNIRHHTGGRFNPAGQLNEAPRPLPAGPAAVRCPLPQPAPMPAGPVALLVHDDDLLAETLPINKATVVAIAGATMPRARSPWGCAPSVADWAHAAMADGLARAGAHFGVPATPVADIIAWAEGCGCTRVVTPYAPVGWTADWLRGIELGLATRGIRLHRVLRDWDLRYWPNATAGFFAFWRAVNGSRPADG